MKIAITGANGFVGTTLINYLNQKGYKPLALVRKPYVCSAASLKVIDYSNPDSILAAITDADILIHNAGMTKSFYRNDMLAANVGITRNVVNAVNRTKHSIRFIYISSQAAAGPSSIAKPAKESDLPAPISTYGKSKAIAEKVVQTQCTKSWNILRPCSVYGPGDRDFLNLFKLCAKGISIQIGINDAPLNMIHVTQLADFILHVIANHQISGEIFFATDNQIYTQSQIADTICTAMGKTPRKIIIPEALAYGAFAISDVLGRLQQQPGALNLEKFRELSAEGWVADPQKAEKLLGWNPRAEFPKLIEETYRWYLKESWL